MNKYNSIPLKPHKAQVEHACYFCNNKINPGELFFYQSDRFLSFLSNKKFCKVCYDKYGQKLLEMKKVKKIDNKQKTLL